ncbi:hypothetical protein MKW92_028667 [Papaver armeniacum]|nr:hypothetical protein MKW92_028667 [Papaver armeniacum]
MSLGNVADITSNGLLRLTNDFDCTYQMSFVYYSHPIRFKNNNTGGGSVFSFSTSFIFSIVPESSGLRGLGIAFIIAPQAELPGERGSELPGLFDPRNDAQPTKFVLAIELDTIHNTEYDSIQGDHVGIDFNDLTSVISKPSGYYTDNNGSFRNLSLISGDPIRVWIEYNDASKNLTVTLAPLTVPKPGIPLLSYNHDLSDFLLDSMYVGFSSATSFAQISHYILGWSFMINNGTDLPINLSQLPKLPAKEQKRKRAAAKFLGVELPIIIPVLVLALTFTIGILFVLRIIRNRKLRDDVVEDWELNYERLRFSFKHLYIATNGFKEKNLLGNGSFGKVYKVCCLLQRSMLPSKESLIIQSKEYGNLFPRSLALTAWRIATSVRYMSNGSLDKLLFHKYDSASAPPTILDWNQRFQIIKGVACALVYLHEDWEQVVVHRDIKASNVLLDGEMNARLGDFGLARLYDRGTNPKTTNVAGTLGYMAPELIRTGKATTSSDVFAFGALLLEVACGRRPIELNVPESKESEILVDWVLNCWRSGAILQTSDPILGNEYIKEEMELVLKLGLLCSQNDANARPSMRQAMQYLDGELALPQTELWALYYANSSSGEHRSCKGSMSPSMSKTSSVAESLLSGPR